MPVKKLTFEEMEDSLWRKSDDPQLWKQIENLWRFSDQVSHSQFQKGVKKFHSIEERNRLTDLKYPRRH